MRVWLVFVFGFLSISPLVGLIGLPVRGAFWVALCVLPFLVFTFLGGKLKIQPFFILFACAALVLGSITAIYWGEPRFAYYSIFFILSVYMFSVLSSTEVSLLVSIASHFLLILVVGAWIGFLLAQSGVQPNFSFPRTIFSGQTIDVYYTTITNFVRGDFIRPAGIYDEPGSLSMYICAVAAARHLMRKNSRYTWVLLSLGFITFSLAHLIYVVVHAFSEKIKLRGVMLVMLAAIVSLPLLISSGLSDAFQSQLSYRLSFDSDGNLRGDNRSFRFYNAAEYIGADSRVFLFGLDPELAYPVGASYRNYNAIGENPLFPLVATGIFVSWPYYFFLAFLFVFALNGRRHLVLFGIALLFLQRPYVLNLGLSTLAVMVCTAAIIDFKSGSGLLKQLITPNLFVKRGLAQKTD